MIFISVGTEKFQFDRLIKAIDYAVQKNKLKDEVVAQTGNCKYKPQYLKYYNFLQYQDYIEYLKKSKILVVHAGVGTILNCLEINKIPIIFPRLFKYGEHVDNHQYEFAVELNRLELALIANDENDLIYKICNYNQQIKKLKRNNISTKAGLVSYLLKIVKSF